MVDDGNVTPCGPALVKALTEGSGSSAFREKCRSAFIFFSVLQMLHDYREQCISWNKML